MSSSRLYTMVIKACSISLLAWCAQWTAQHHGITSPWVGIVFAFIVVNTIDLALFIRNEHRG